MSAEDSEERMDTSEGADNVELPAAADVDMKAEAQRQEYIQHVISIKWEDSFPTSKKQDAALTKALLSWATRNHPKADISVVNSSEDEALIKIDNASALTKLLESSGQTLDVRGKNVATLLPISPPGAQVPRDVPMALPPPSVPLVTEQQQERSEISSSVADSAAEEICYVPIGLYWYVNNIYKEKIDRIEKENGVQISAQIEVKLSPGQKNGDVQKAMDEFRNLIQATSTESEGFNFPLEMVSAEAWGDMLKVLQKKHDKVLLTLHSKEIMVCGSGQSQGAIRQSLNSTMQKTSAYSKLFGVSSSDETPKMTGMNINDPLIYAGIDIDEGIWRMMTASSEQVEKLKTKFDVDFKESVLGQGQVNIKVGSRRSKQNTSMESHAVRALLRLYQRISTSAQDFGKHLGVTGFSSPPKAYDYQPEGLPGGAASKGPPGYSSGDTEELSGGAAAAGDDKDDICPVCLDKFTDKIQLKCKHEFCQVCLEEAKKTQGPICPVCKDVFGKVEGNQPDGKMSWKTISYHLEGFPKCGTIVISYDIPSGIQTMKHPNPGQLYPKIHREAYLPDNKKGNEVLQLLKRAFDQKLIFTIGTSRTSGLDNQVTWNDIHHKTSLSGGPQSFGYPDSDYLCRVREELKAKGIK